jgi:hypothetical protein
MTLNELIEKLTEVRDRYGDYVGQYAEVRLAIQPHYPLQSTLEGVVAIRPHTSDIDALGDELDSLDEDDPDRESLQAMMDELVEDNLPVIYLAEGSQVADDPYAPSGIW